MAEFDLQIGPAVIRFTAEHLPDGLMHSLIQPFQLEQPGRPDLTLRLHTDHAPDPETAAPIAECPESWKIYPVGKQLRMDILDPEDARVRQVALLNSSWTEVDFYLLPPTFERFNRPRTLWYLGEVLEPFVQWWLTAWLANRGQGIILHSSAVVLDGRGMVFSAPSEGGKTTLARLFLERGEATVLNDERVVIWQEGSGWKVSGTPWHGELRRVSSAVAPLKRLCMLKKGPVNEFVLRSAGALLPRIIPEAFLPLWNPQAMNGLLDALAQITQEVTCGELQFRPDTTVVDYLRELQNSEGQTLSVGPGR